MHYFCYTRTENEEKAYAAFTRMRGPEIQQPGNKLGGTAWDALSGQRGLAQALRWTEQGEGVSKAIIVDNLSDLGKDVPGLVKQINALLEAGISVHSIATGLWFHADQPNDVEPQVIKALAAAHIHYTKNNRRAGIANAKASGAQIGRPFSFTLSGARATINEMMTQNKPHLPSARDLANKLGCGKTKAAALIKEWKVERAR